MDIIRQALVKRSLVMYIILGVACLGKLWCFEITF